MTALPPSRGLASAEWLAENLDRADVLIFDSSTDIELDAAGHEHVVAKEAAFRDAHIPGARFIDLQRDLSDAHGTHFFTLPSASAFEAALRRLGVNRDSVVVVYSTGNPWWATRIWWLFQHFGLDNAYVLDGGLRYWRTQGYPIATGAADAAREGNVRVATDRGLALSAEQLLSRLGAVDLKLVNALSPDKFAGTTRVHGGRPGHIPGSLNLPAAALVDAATGKFVDDETARDLLARRGLIDHPGEIVAYCGGGISATLLLLALARTGHTRARLYDGSLAEWANRDDLPLTVSPLVPEA